MSYAERYTAYLAQVQEGLERLTARCFNERSNAAKAAIYSLMAGGKRVRAVLCLAVCDMFDGNMQAAADFAAAVEMLHCYSLIHDDLPCMDDDDYRRGQPSCHKAFDEATALLAGDALLTGAFEVLAEANAPFEHRVQAVGALSRAAGTQGMIWGQELDLHFETLRANEAQLREIHRNKTGMLISAAARLGAIAANASDAEKAAVDTYAFALGLVFQIVDDILDVTATAQELGKPIGSDSANGKTTFVSLLGIQNSRELARQLTMEATDALRVQLGEKADFLISLANDLLARNK